MRALSTVLVFLSLVVLPSSAFMGQQQHQQQQLVKTFKTSHQQHTTTTRRWGSPEPLAEEGSWQAFLDEETTGLIYYFDTKTGQSLWEPPTASFPEVRLPRRKQRLADNLRRAYRKCRQQEMTGSTGGKDSYDGSTSSTTILEEQEEVDERQPNWIEGILEAESKESAEKTMMIEQIVQEQEESPKWFNFFDDVGGKKDSAATIETTPASDENKPQSWLKDIFGVGKTETDTNGNAALQEDKKFGILESFATFSIPTSPFREEVVKTKMTKPVKREKEEVVVVVEKPKPKTKKQDDKFVKIPPKPITIEIRSHILPHPERVGWGGEDAVFVKGRTFGVFDGVSGAEKLEGVPLYSRTLANEMQKMVGTEGVTIQELTTYLTNAALYADDAATGASTAVVASIGENGFLQALNVGDSNCMVIRDGRVTAKTREISHFWECPYQLAENSNDRPRDGTKLNVELMPGDVVVMGSDGVFDNVNDDLLVELVRKNPGKAASLAKKICDLSRRQMVDVYSETPFGKQAQRRGDPDYIDGLGGKLDDVSCVVAICK
jgi:protein phosphatase PTC7